MFLLVIEGYFSLFRHIFTIKTYNEVVKRLAH